MKHKGESGGGNDKRQHDATSGPAGRPERGPRSGEPLRVALPQTQGGMAQTKRDRRAQRHSAARVARGRASSRSGTHTPLGRGGAGAGEPPRSVISPQFQSGMAQTSGRGGRTPAEMATMRSGNIWARRAIASREPIGIKGESGWRVRRASAEGECGGAANRVGRAGTQWRVRRARAEGECGGRVRSANEKPAFVGRTCISAQRGRERSERPHSTLGVLFLPSFKCSIHPECYVFYII